MRIELSKKMMAINITEPGGPEVLAAVEKCIPTIAKNEVLVKVAAAGVNRPDVMQRLGKYPPPSGASDIPGLEISGTVIDTGDNVKFPEVGSQICALVSGGGYAEYCVVPARLCLPIPKGLSMIEAAAIPETFFTVWDNVFTRGNLVAGERILVHGGSSGIGTTAIQLAKARGAEVFATAGNNEKCRACERLGAVCGINYNEKDFVEVIRARTANEGIDLVLDMIGGEYMARNLNCLSFGGRLIQIATQMGTKSKIPAHLIMVKQLVITGSTMRTRPLSEKAIIAEQLQDKVWPLIEDGSVKPQIWQTFGLHDASSAHRLMDRGTHIGKIVLVT